MGEINRLYKADQSKVIDGVCAGFAEFIGIDAFWVRVGWALLTLLGGIGIVAYLLAMYLFPRKQNEGSSSVKAEGHPRMAIGGVILLAVGVLILLRLFGIVHYDFWAAWDIAWSILWPLSLIGGGAILLLSYWRQSREGDMKLQRSLDDKRILGVCGALGRFYKIDPNVVRFIFALAIILSRGIALIVYVTMVILIPHEAREAK